MVNQEVTPLSDNADSEEPQIMVVDDEESIVRFMKIALEDHGYKVTVSAGLAGYPGDARTRESLIKKADEALYQAKNMGKNILCVCDGN